MLKRAAMTTEKIARFIANTSYEKVPGEAIHIAKMCLLDCLGVALAGTTESTSKIITEYVREMGGKPESGVIGGGYKTTAAFSALANGTIAHALDFDDYAITSACHPTVVLLSAIFALANRDGLSGRKILESYIVGWEVGSKLGNELSPALQARGWHPTSTIGTVAATAACSKLLGLTTSQAQTAMGIAASEASGLSKNFGTDTKPFHAGKAASNAITAALLAQKGFTASPDMLEGPGGFCQVLANKECNPGAFAQTPDAAFEILTSYAIKPYPSCGLTHRCIDATLDLVKKHRITPDRVTQVECHIPPMFTKILVYSRPQNGLEAKFSMEYCIAAALVDQEITLRQFVDETVLSSEAKDLIPKVMLCLLAGVEKQNIVAIPQAVKITLSDGNEYFHEIRWPRGSAGNPMTWDEVVAKFRNCAEDALALKDVDRVTDLLSRLESLANIDELMEIVAKTRL